MKINRKLNIVFPVDREDGTQVHVHSTPISKEVFDKYFDVISMTYNQALLKYGNASTRVCHKLLKQISEKEGKWSDVRVGLRAEILRLTNVLVPSEHGWQTLMFDDAINGDYIDSDDADVIEGMLTFFTLSSWMLTSRQSKEMTELLSASWSGHSTSLECMDYLNSLQTSTHAAPSTPKVELSEPPSTGLPAMDGKRSSAMSLISHGSLLQNLGAVSS